MKTRLLLMTAITFTAMGCAPNISMPKLGENLSRNADLEKCNELSGPQRITCQDETRRRHEAMDVQIDAYEHEQRERDGRN